MVHLVPIVEGQGEVEAVPELLRRIARDVGASGVPAINPPIRVKAKSFLNHPDYFRAYFAMAAAKARQRQGTVLILLDCDDDCPATLGPRLLAEGQAVAADVPVLVVLACREFESWFLAAADSLAGFQGLAKDLEAADAPDTIRGAKEWLSARMVRSYEPTRHQLPFTRRFDLSQARRSRSFDRLYRKLETLFRPAAVRAGS